MLVKINKYLCCKNKTNKSIQDHWVIISRVCRKKYYLFNLLFFNIIKYLLLITKTFTTFFNFLILKFYLNL